MGAGGGGGSCSRLSGGAFKVEEVETWERRITCELLWLESVIESLMDSLRESLLRSLMELAIRDS